MTRSQPQTGADLEYLLEHFLNNAFMVRALVAGVLVSIACALVGTFVVAAILVFS